MTPRPPTHADVKAAIRAAGARGSAVHVDEVAGDLARAFPDEDGLIRIMFSRIVIAEGARENLAMRLGATAAR